MTTSLTVSWMAAVSHRPSVAPSSTCSSSWQFSSSGSTISVATGKASSPRFFFLLSSSASQWQLRWQRPKSKTSPLWCSVRPSTTTRPSRGVTSSLIQISLKCRNIRTGHLMLTPMISWRHSSCRLECLRPVCWERRSTARSTWTFSRRSTRHTETTSCWSDTSNRAVRVCLWRDLCSITLYLPSMSWPQPWPHLDWRTARSLWRWVSVVAILYSWL